MRQPEKGVCAVRTIVTLLTFVVLFATSTLAQQTEGVDRVLHFTATGSPQNIEEIATVIRSITDIPQASVDTTEKSLTLHGTAGQIALAEWLFTNLDKPASDPAPPGQNGAKHEYRVSDSDDDVVRLFYLTNPEVPRGMQEIATAVRSLASIRRMFTYNDLRAVAVRGTAEQGKVAEFLFAEMDKPAVVHTPAQKLQSGASPEFRMKEPPENLVRVFYLPNTETVRDFQEIVTLVRSITNLRYAFTYNSSRAIGARGTDDQIALAKWLFANLDAASIPEARSDPGAQEYRLSPTKDEFVRVFYLAHAVTREHLQETATQIRSKINARYVFTYSAPSAVAIRGTAQQIAQADRLIQEQDK
jgi:hypothetical protein